MRSQQLPENSNQGQRHVWGGHFPNKQKNPEIKKLKKRFQKNYIFFEK